MSAPFKDATNDAVQFLTKHGDLTRAAAYDAIRLLTGNGFVVTQTDMLPSATDLSQAAVAAALEAAAAICADHMAVALQDEKDPEALKGYARGMYFAARQQGIEIRAQITQPQHDALAAHVAAEVAKARADQARDAALVEAAGTLEVQALDAEAQAKLFRGGSDPWADRTARSRALRNSAAAILALRDKPACAKKTSETAPQPALCDTSEPQAYTQDDDLDDPFAKTAPEATVQDAVKSIINNLSSTYTARNGRKMTIEGDDGEMCWILSNDGYDALRAIAGGGDE